MPKDGMQDLKCISCFLPVAQIEEIISTELQLGTSIVAQGASP